MAGSFQEEGAWFKGEQWGAKPAGVLARFIADKGHEAVLGARAAAVRRLGGQKDA